MSLNLEYKCRRSLRHHVKHAACKADLHRFEGGVGLWGTELNGAYAHGNSAAVIGSAKSRSHSEDRLNSTSGQTRHATDRGNFRLVNSEADTERYSFRCWRLRPRGRGLNKSARSGFEPFRYLPRCHLPCRAWRMPSAKPLIVVPAGIESMRQDLK